MTQESVQIESSLAAVRDHTRCFSDFTFVYPVISRRSRGLSIGVNLNPDKVCNFDCIYCEVDRAIPGRASRVDLAQVREELTAMIRFAREGGLAREPKFCEAPELTLEVRDIAFSGDGEPTMVRNFDECASVVVEVKRAEGLHDTKIVLVTDAAGLDKASVKRGLEIMDANEGEIWGKLDAGTEAYYKLINRSHIRLGRILTNLTETAKARPIIIQSLFMKVHGDPMPKQELEAYCDRLNEITSAGGQLIEVHAYTVARPTPEDYVARLNARELESMGEVIRGRTGLKVETFD